jgi:hypothetical protein
MTPDLVPSIANTRTWSIVTGAASGQACRWGLHEPGCDGDRQERDRVDYDDRIEAAEYTAMPPSGEPISRAIADPAVLAAFASSN